jgi:hypothetical protein
VARFFLIVQISVISILVSACGAEVVKEPAAPPRDREHYRSEAAPDSAREPERSPLVAPPPAYGNKIVLASVPPSAS